MTKEEFNKLSGDTYWQKRANIAQNGTFKEIAAFRRYEEELSNNNGSSFSVQEDPRDIPDMSLFLLLRWRCKCSPLMSEKNIDELLGMHPDSPCAKCKHSSAQETCPGYSGNPMWGSLRCNCAARREKIAAEAKANARRMWEENHGAWATYEEFLKAMPGIEKDDVYASEQIGREQYWEGEPCEYFEQA